MLFSKKHDDTILSTYGFSIPLERSKIIDNKHSIHKLLHYYKQIYDMLTFLNNYVLLNIC